MVETKNERFMRVCRIEAARCKYCNAYEGAFHESDCPEIAHLQDIWPINRMIEREIE